MARTATADSKASEATFISQVFHDLSQPLTALHCTLDLALQIDGSPEQLRASVQAALDHAERLRQRLLLIRALNDADDPGSLSAPVDMSTLLAQLAEDMVPLFESGGRHFELRTSREPLLVRVNPVRLTRALFAFLEYLYRYLPGDRMVMADLGENGRHAEIRIDAESSLPVGPSVEGFSCQQSCEAELVRRTFAAAGGRFTLLSVDAARCVWLGTLPLV